MSTSKNILIAADASDASGRAVGYVADMIRGAAGIHVGLAHLVLPPRMGEWGGSEDPAIEEKVEAERAAIYRRMEEEVIEKGRVLLANMQRSLAEKGIDVTAQVVQFAEPLKTKEVVRGILKTAREGDYGTVVVGRHSFSALNRLFKHHVGEELVRAGGGIAVWVVE